MAEELNKPAAAPKAAPEAPASNVGSGDMANLIGNVGVLLDSAVESVQGVISTVSTATGQLIEGVTATLKSEPVQHSVQELGKFWEGLLSNLNETVNSGQVKDLFDNVSAGLNQLVGNVFSSAMPQGLLPLVEDKKKHVQEIHVIHTKEAPAAAAPAAPSAPAPAAAPAAPATTPANPPARPPVK